MVAKKIVVSEKITVKDFADLLQINPIGLMKGLMRNGVMITVNQFINFDIAKLVAKQYGYNIEKKVVYHIFYIKIILNYLICYYLA